MIGVVKDSSGAAIAAARVVAVNQETSAELEAVTDQEGNYQFQLMRAGTYRVVAEHPGFQRLQRNDVIVNTTERVRVDLMLTIGAVSETVSVTAETPLLQTERATVGQVVEQRTIQSIPLSHAQFHTNPGHIRRRDGFRVQRRQPGNGQRQRERERRQTGIQ